MDISSLVQTIAISAMPVIFAITVHEAAHGYAARHFGDNTAWLAGRISLNPIRHVDLFGTILLRCCCSLSAALFCLVGPSRYRSILTGCAIQSATCCGWLPPGQRGGTEAAYNYIGLRTKRLWAASCPMIHSFYANTEEEHTYLAFHRHFMSGMGGAGDNGQQSGFGAGVAGVVCCLG
jgi:Peptidase family M50.